MKKTLAVLALFLSLALVQATPTPRPAKLIWNANPPAEGVTGYNVYEQSGQVWTKLATVAVLEFPITLDGQPHVFAITVVTDFFESDRALVNAPTAPGVPTGLRIVATP